MKNRTIILPYTWGIAKRKDGRFEIYDTLTNLTVDDSNGHGFKSYKSAYNYGFNMFGNSGRCTEDPNKDELRSQSLF